MTASMEGNMPTIDNAPGLKWRKTKIGWEARWRARADLVRKGFAPKIVRLWASRPGHTELDDFDIAYIKDRCEALQSEMLVWAHGELPKPDGNTFTGTIRSLINCYRTDPDSKYCKPENKGGVRYNTRLYYDTLCDMVTRDIGDRQIGEISARDLLRWHECYHDRVAMGHSLVGMLRTLATFGATLLGRRECRDLKELLGDMRFKMPKPRTERLTADMVVAIRREAHKAGRPSIALAQALQFEMTLRQKDIIGEWLPISEPGLSAVVNGNSKWLRGLDWKEVDANFICTHITSKRQKPITIDLHNAPMVIEELGRLERSRYPASGPLITDERTNLPFTAPDFRRTWRRIADSANVPKTVRNMDTRAGAISEATDAGAPLEKVRKTATHSNIEQTTKYSRGDAEAIADVMQMRSEHRKKPVGPNGSQGS